MSARYDLHVVNDIAMRRWLGATTVLGTYRSRAAAGRALSDQLRSHGQCVSSYSVVERAA